MIRLIQILKKENVAIPVQNVVKGAVLEGGLIALNDVPQGHKIALCDSGFCSQPPCFAL